VEESAARGAEDLRLFGLRINAEGHKDTEYTEEELR
jgi:hypothetical protein